jgi:hypothetical protein
LKGKETSSGSPFFLSIAQLPADFVNATQFYPEQIEQTLRYPPRAEGGSASRGVSPPLFTEHIQLQRFVLSKQVIHLRQMQQQQ